MLKYTTTLNNQKEHSLFKTVSVKTACPKKPQWICTLGRVAKEVLQVAIPEYINFLRKNTKKSCMQKRQKRWQYCSHPAKTISSLTCTKIPEKAQPMSLNCLCLSPPRTVP